MNRSRNANRVGRIEHGSCWQLVEDNAASICALSWIGVRRVRRDGIGAHVLMALVA